MLEIIEYLAPYYAPQLQQDVYSIPRLIVDQFYMLAYQFYILYAQPFWDRKVCTASLTAKFGATCSGCNVALVIGSNLPTCIDMNQRVTLLQ